MEDPAQGAETDAVETLIDLWVADADVAGQVAALPWASDGVDSLERDALRSLLGVTTTDALLAGEIIAFPWMVDSITEAESSILDRLVGIASSDTDLANQVVSLPWLVDGVTDDERVMLTALNRILTTDTTLAKRVAALPWFIDDVEEVEWVLLDQLLGIAFRNIDLANQVVSLSWLVDSVTDAESAVIAAFAAARSEDVEFVNWAVTLPWLGDGVTEVETAALRHALRLGEIDPDLAWATAVLPWFVDGLTGDERNAVDFLEIIARAEVRGASEGDMGAQLAKLLLSRPWLVDGVIQSEAAVIHALLNIAERDLNLARQIAALPWLTDDATVDEWSASSALDNISEKDLELSRLVAAFPWFVDDVTTLEVEVLRQLHTIASRDLGLANAIATLPWFSDGVTQAERASLKHIFSLIGKDPNLANFIVGTGWFAEGVTERESNARVASLYIATQDAELFNEVAALPWFVDGVTELESSAIYSLATIASRDIEFARTVIGWPRFGGGVQRDLDFFFLHALGRSDPELLATLTARTWFDDGLTDKEAALVVTLAGQNPSLYKALLIDSNLYHESISLPLAGEVNVWLVQDTSPVLNQESLRQIEYAARVAEEFFGVPFPTTDIIVLVVTEGKSEYGHLVQHLGSLMSVVVSRGQLYGILHEAAHYYLTSNFQGHPWFTEGGANFIEALVNHERGRQDISSRETVVSKEVQSFCIDSGVENIRHNAYLLERGQVSYFQCNYRLGEYLLLNLLKIMGKNAMSAALNELYVSSGGHVPALRFSTPPSEEDIYETFLKHAPDQQERVRELFRSLHGGDFAFPEIDFADEEADEAEDARLIAIGEVVTGSLDYIFDFDYFQFQAEEGQTYLISVEHETLGHTSITLYAPDGVSEERDRWKARSMGPDGPLILWEAPSSEEYYVSIQNFGGKTGEYAFAITPVDVADTDDHGDGLESATRIGRSKRIQGTIDDTFDEDYFRFNAYEGRVYHIFMRPESTTDLCAQMYRADGDRSSEWHNRCDHGNLWEGGLVHGIRWVAPETGDFYLAISGFMESVGDYNFEIILALDPGNPS